MKKIKKTLDIYQVHLHAEFLKSRFIIKTKGSRHILYREYVYMRGYNI